MLLSRICVKLKYKTILPPQKITYFSKNTQLIPFNRAKSYFQLVEIEQIKCKELFHPLIKISISLEKLKSFRLKKGNKKNC